VGTSRVLGPERGSAGLALTQANLLRSHAAVAACRRSCCVVAHDHGAPRAVYSEQTEALAVSGVLRPASGAGPGVSPKVLALFWYPAGAQGGR